MRETEVGPAMQSLLDSIPPEMLRKIRKAEREAESEEAATSVRDAASACVTEALHACDMYAVVSALMSCLSKLSQPAAAAATATVPAAGVAAAATAAAATSTAAAAVLTPPSVPCPMLLHSSVEFQHSVDVFWSGLQSKALVKAAARRKTHRRLRIISGSAGGEIPPLSLVLRCVRRTWTPKCRSPSYTKVLELAAEQARAICTW